MNAVKWGLGVVFLLACSQAWADCMNPPCHVSPCYEGRACVDLDGCQGRIVCEGETSYCACQPLVGSLYPSYMIVSVVYAPVGHSSYVQYGSGSSIGTNVSTSSSWKDEIHVDVTTGAGFLGTGGEITTSWGSSFGGGSSASKDMVAKFNADIRIPGQGADTINHDYDQIFLLLGPRLEGTINDPPFNTDISWAVDVSRTVPQIVLVGWLKGTLDGGVPPNVYALLNSYGITEADYPQMLSADPFANDPDGVTVPDPTRFTLAHHSSYPYEPYIGEAFTDTTNNNYTTVDTQTSSNSYNVGVTAQTGFDFILKGKLKVSDTFTWTYGSSNSNTVSTSDTETFQIGMPAPEYLGPTVLWVYVDKIYKTFMVSFIPPY